MRFRSFDSLRVFIEVAQHKSFTAAADGLNLSKGAVSYQISQLENELVFKVFDRQKRGIFLTEQGRQLLHLAETSLGDLERQIERIRKDTNRNITIGMSTYFASRWLSPKLMHFMANYEDIGLRIQPLVDLIDLRRVDIDMAIRWGKGDWTDPNTTIESLFSCPAMLTAGIAVYDRIEQSGIEAALGSLLLLDDRDGSHAWQDWFEVAGLPMVEHQKNLVIPDPNVRVQTVVDNQGVALNDALVENELKQGLLKHYDAVRLEDYGYYLVYPENALEQPALRAFRDWVIGEAARNS